MAIESKELKRMFALVMVIVGFSLIDEPVRDFILSITGLSSFVAGIIILLTAAYFFDVGR